MSPLEEGCCGCGGPRIVFPCAISDVPVGIIATRIGGRAHSILDVNLPKKVLSFLENSDFVLLVHVTYLGPAGILLACRYRSYRVIPIVVRFTVNNFK